MQRFRLSLYDYSTLQPFDSSGTFQRAIPGGWKADAAANIKIRADRHDLEDDGFAAGLSNCLTKNGLTQPTANLPMNGKKLTGVGDPTGPQDVATKNYVDTFKSFTTGSIITGADANGRLLFSSPSGTNGIAWTGADLSWVARLATTTPTVTNNRLALNDKVDATGTDVFWINDNGYVNINSFIGVNYQYDGTNWRTIAAGFSPFLSFEPSSGFLRFYTNPTTLAANTVSPIAAVFSVSPAGAVSVSSTITSGAITSSGRVQGSDILSAGPVYAASGAAYLATNGDLSGSIWSNWGSTSAYNAINARIEARAAAYANNCVQQMRSAGYVVYNPASGGDGGMTNSGYYCVMAQRQSSDKYVFGFRMIQMYVPSQGWLQATAW